MPPTEIELLDALKTVIDPNTGKDFVSTRQLKNLSVTVGTNGCDVAFDVELGYPAKSQIAGLQTALIAAAKTVNGVNKVTANLTVKIRSDLEVSFGRSFLHGRKSRRGQFFVSFRSGLDAHPPYPFLTSAHPTDS